MLMIEIPLPRTHNHPFTKSDDANNREGVQMHEHLLLHISRGSKDNNISTDETKNYNPTKRLAEVDCTTGRIINILQAYSAN